jgi:uncharacterized protein Yka (UPF0111/DUF47 family)
MPDVVGMLRAQAAKTIDGLAALERWAAGDAAAAEAVREAEHAADDAKRALWTSLREAFSTPLEREDLFSLSSLLDEVLNQAKNAVREAEVMAVAPDMAMAEMASLVAKGVGHLDEAFAHLPGDADGATAAADAAVKCQRELERVYRRAMSALVDVADLREVSARRELYRRLARMAETASAAADRVWYSVLKDS